MNKESHILVGGCADGKRIAIPSDMNCITAVEDSTEFLNEVKRNEYTRRKIHFGSFENRVEYFGEASLSDREVFSFLLESHKKSESIILKENKTIKNKDVEWFISSYPNPPKRDDGSIDFELLCGEFLSEGYSIAEVKSNYDRLPKELKRQ